jgi:hypothetical protein
MTDPIRPQPATADGVDAEATVAVSDPGHATCEGDHLMYAIRIDSIRNVSKVDRSARGITLRSRRAAREAELIRHALEAYATVDGERERSSGRPGSGYRAARRIRRPRWA